MKSPALPLLIPALLLYITCRAILDLLIFSYPYLKSLAIASYRLAKVLLQHAFETSSTWGDRVRDYFYPINEENSLDVLLLMLLSDLGRAIAAFSRLGARICE